MKPEALRYHRLEILYPGKVRYVGICLVLFLLILFVSRSGITFSRYEFGEAQTTDASVTLSTFTTETASKKPQRNAFYNRFGKCGSRSLLNLVKRLSTKNDFHFVASSIYNVMRPPLQDMLQEVRKIGTLKKPSFYNRHIHFLNFEKYGYEMPIYINLIRDPIDRFVSDYNYRKYGDHNRNIKSSPTRKLFELDINECVMKNAGACNSGHYFYYVLQYFCGFDPVCAVPSQKSVELAKKHIDQYLFIGMTEEFETTLKILEKILPEYFDGAVEDWRRDHESRNKTASYKMDSLSEESTEKLRKRDMFYEYKVYNHAKRRFKEMKRKLRLP